MNADIDGVLRAVAAHGCAGRLRLPDDVLADELFHAVIARAGGQRLIGLLASAVADGLFPVTGSQLEKVIEQEEFWVVQVLRLERLMLDIAELFDRRGVPYRVFKGPSLAHRAYPDPRLRVFADIDLLVPGDRLKDAEHALAAALGATRQLPEIRPGFDREFGKEVLFEVDGYEIDVHRTFVAGPAGLTIPVDELFDTETTFELGGRSIGALGPIEEFVQTCLNAAVGDFPPRPCSLRDVAQLAPSVVDDAQAVMATATRWRVGLSVIRAIELAQSELQLDQPPLAVDAGSYRPTVTERVGMRAYLTTARSYARPAAAVLAIRGVGPRLRYLRAIASPQESYLAFRNWDRRHNARRALRRLRGR